MNMVCSSVGKASVLACMFYAGETCTLPTCIFKKHCKLESVIYINSKAKTNPGVENLRLH
jgi:hypothetical protein